MEELGLDDLPAGEVLVEVSWSSVNYKDGMVTVPGQPGGPHSRRSCPGSTWPAWWWPATTRRWRWGPRSSPTAAIWAWPATAGSPRYARVPARGPPSPSPPGSRRRQAMTIGTAGFTAALSLDQLEQRGLAPGDGPVLVTGASGGVGSFAVDLLAGRGYEVVASTGKADEHAWLERLGATEVIGRDELDESARARARPRALGRRPSTASAVTPWPAILQTLRYGGGGGRQRAHRGHRRCRRTVYAFITRGVALLGVDSVRTPLERRRQVWAPPRHRPAARPISTTWSPGRCRSHDVAGALADILAARVRGRLLVRASASARPDAVRSARRLGAGRRRPRRQARAGGAVVWVCGDERAEHGRHGQGARRRTP